MTLDDITPPANFLVLKAIFRSMLPPEWTQRDGYPARIEVSSGGEYVEITSHKINRQEGEVDEGSDTEREAVLAWWANFLTYAKECGSTEIVWRIRPEFDSHVYPEVDPFTGRPHPRAGQRVYRVYARIFISKGPDADRAALLAEHKRREIMNPGERYMQPAILKPDGAVVPPMTGEDLMRRQEEAAALLSGDVVVAP